MPTDFVLELPHDPTASAVARSALRDRFRDALSGPRLEDLALLLTELVNNAVEHGKHPVHLTVQLDGKCVRAEITDGGGGFEHEARERGVDEVGGRGLGIVERLATRWGIHEGTTHVWAEMATHVWAEMDSGGSRDLRTEAELGEQARPPKLDDAG